MATTEKKEELQVQKKIEQENMSERFTSMVLSEFNGTVSGGIEVTNYQRSLIQNYFIGIDRCLKIQEENRIIKNSKNTDHKYDNKLPMVWQNVNLRELAIDVVHYSKMGLDMMQKNHISPIPYKNNKTNQYDITLMLGYSGIEYIAKKYALDAPVNVTVELVYSNDVFKPIKKSFQNKVESYEFEIKNAFDRGEILGGFGYIEFSDSSKNKLVVMTLKDIMKRKPRYAAAEFWGGTKKVWENGKQIEVETDGWFAEMCEKTIKREIFGDKNIARDPKKIDDDYQFMKSREAKIAEIETQAEIDENANKIYVDADTGEVVDDVPAEITETASVDDIEDDLP